MNVKKTIGVLLAVLTVGIATRSVHSAGFALWETSGSAEGSAAAGATAGLDDPGSLFFNTAAATRLEGTQLALGLHVISPHAGFDKEGSGYPLLGNFPLFGGEDANAGKLNIMPNVYFSHAVDETLTLGLGVFVPFGLATEYSCGWVGRYQALGSRLMTVDINPSVAVRLHEKLSVGAGLSLQYAEAKLSKAVDFGTIQATWRRWSPVS